MAINENIALAPRPHRSATVRQNTAAGVAADAGGCAGGGGEEKYASSPRLPEGEARLWGEVCQPVGIKEDCFSSMGPGGRRGAAFAGQSPGRAGPPSRRNPLTPLGGLDSEREIQLFYPKGINSVAQAFGGSFYSFFWYYFYAIRLPEVR